MTGLIYILSGSKVSFTKAAVSFLVSEGEVRSVLVLLQFDQGALVEKNKTPSAGPEAPLTPPHPLEGGAEHKDF